MKKASEELQGHGGVELHELSNDSETHLAINENEK